MIERLADAVRGELARFGPAAGVAEIVAAWPDAVGEAIARNAWPARLARDGTLHVTTDSSAWAFELGQLAPTLLERLRGALGGDAPTALRFAVGDVPEVTRAAQPERVRPTLDIRPEDAELAASLAAGIDDAELRRLVARAAAASLARAAADRGF